MSKQSDALKRFNLLAAEIDSYYHMAAVKKDVADSVMDILYVLYDFEEGCNQSEIYKLTGTSRQTVNSAIKKMEKEGLLELRSGYGRNTIVVLSDRGKELQDICAKPLVDAENEIFNEWTKEEREEFLRLNTLYLDGIKKRIGSWESLKKTR
mgnify:FL=1